MGFVKVQKDKAYYKRLQTKYRRRREGKTDYHARRKMVAQAKNKYNTPKYRLVVRRTNRKIVCQIVFSTIMGDRVLCQALSTELPNYGIPCGLTNYSACYATGLLIARRALEIVGLNEAITGVEEVNAEEYHVEDEEHDQRPFRVILDVGRTRTVSGARCFGVLKGAVDGGLYVPHTVKKFPGYTGPEERGMEYQYDAEAHLERIIGGHVSEYMEKMKEEDPEKFAVAFGKYIENDVDAENIEDMYREAHKKIRENPTFEPVEKSGITNKRQGNLVVSSNGNEYTRHIKLTVAQRKDRVKQKMATAQQKLLAAMEAAADE